MSHVLVYIHQIFPMVNHLEFIMKYDEILTHSKKSLNILQRWQIHHDVFYLYLSKQIWLLLVI